MDPNSDYFDKPERRINGLDIIFYAALPAIYVVDTAKKIAEKFYTAIGRETTKTTGGLEDSDLDL